MNKHFDMSYLGVMVDMVGCPNHCRHCWLGSHRNGNISVDELRVIAAQFKNWRDEDGRGIAELGFFSWWREPDYRDDYRELWEIEKEISSPGRAQRFELLSTWRLARDKSYAKWAATLPPKVCQISFFGMEENTDWGMRRKGAFRDQLLATERCLDSGIIPRWQFFVTKRCLNETDEFLRLIKDLRLHAHSEKIGGKFEIFFGGIAPEGNGFELEDVRLEESDLAQISSELIKISRDGLRNFGKPERDLLPELLADSNPPNMWTLMPTLAVDADFDVYPNNAEPAPWWRLGNLKTDSVDAVIKTYRDETPPGMRANREMPVMELAQRYGNPDSTRLYDKGDLLSRCLHMWGEDYMKGISL
jgi:hypothetical protein